METQRQSASSQVPAASLQHLLFVLEEETYGLEISSVREILEFGGVTSVPMMPAHLLGVINLRGRVVPIVDLKSRFGRGPLTVGKRTSVVVVELPMPGQPPISVGVLVSGVTEVVEFEPSQLEPPPTLGAAIRSGFIAGMARHKERFVVLLELSEVLALDELSDVARPGATHVGTH